MNYKKLLTIGTTAALAMTVAIPSRTAYAGQLLQEPGQASGYQSICTLELHNSSYGQQSNMPTIGF